jgi:hypothetical protein
MATRTPSLPEAFYESLHEGARASRIADVDEAARRFSTQFGRPVLLFNGDSHLFEVDHPLAEPTSATGIIHGTQTVPNLTQITVQGSTNAPAEWLKLTIDTRGDTAALSWVNVPYCRDPLTSCN